MFVFAAFVSKVQRRITLLLLLQFNKYVVYTDRLQDCLTFTMLYCIDRKEGSKIILQICYTTTILIKKKKSGLFDKPIDKIWQEYSALSISLSFQQLGTFF